MLYFGQLATLISLVGFFSKEIFLIENQRYLFKPQRGRNPIDFGQSGIIFSFYFIYSDKEIVFCHRGIFKT